MSAIHLKNIINDQNHILNVAKECINTEANALTKMAQALNSEFIEAVNLITQTTGRVVISGMGKSGHIARKIAATLASVGRPALFVHPAEASHGDLGMIASNDCLILLSHSGETPELKPLIDYSKRFNISIIAITAHLNSSLGKSANITLNYPLLEEACPMGLAPTTSTTQMLALGDALAVASLHCRCFTPTDFKIFHPGGNLGKQLTTVEALMNTSTMPLISNTVSMHEAVLAITNYAVGCVGIINEHQKLIGIITDGDIRRNITKDILNKPLMSLMSTNPITITKNTLMAQALNIMQQKAVTSLFICNEEQMPIGLLHIHDCLKHGII